MASAEKLQWPLSVAAIPPPRIVTVRIALPPGSVRGILHWLDEHRSRW